MQGVMYVVRIFSWSWASLGKALGLGLWICVMVGCGEPQTVSDQSESEEEVELAGLMGEMQRHSAKLGYAIEGQNAPLAAFYATEIGEVLEELKAIPSHEDMPIAHPTKTILEPALKALDQTLTTGDWGKVTTDYELLIGACNRCHLATEHDFIEILPATGIPPYNQRFTPRGLNGAGETATESTATDSQ